MSGLDYQMVQRISTGGMGLCTVMCCLSANSVFYTSFIYPDEVRGLDKDNPLELSSLHVAHGPFRATSVRQEASPGTLL